MSLIVTEEQTYPLAAVNPFSELFEGASELTERPSFSADLWLEDGRRFDVRVTAFAIRAQEKEGTPGRFELEGIIISEYKPENDDSNLWESLPQPTGFRASFDASSTPFEKINDVVRVVGEVIVFLAPVGAAASS